MRKVWRELLMAASIMALAACASRGPRMAAEVSALTDPEAVAAAQARQATREAWLRGRAVWGFEGRVAVNQAGKGGSGRLDWQQQADRYVASLSAPVTRQSWRLTVDAEGARLEGLEGGARQGPDAGQLLREATGWEIPLETLSDWARGVVAARGGESGFDSHGQLRSLEQAGWSIRYTDWQAASGGQPAMPRRVEAQRGDARVRLIVDRWDFGPQ